MNSKITEIKTILYRKNDDGERREWKGWLKSQHSKIMASDPIASWQTDGQKKKKVERVADFIFLVSKITADGNCSHEIKRRLLLWRKAVKNLNSISKSKNTTLPTKLCKVKAMVFPGVMYGCESWTILQMSAK